MMRHRECSIGDVLISVGSLPAAGTDAKHFGRDLWDVVRGLLQTYR